MRLVIITFFILVLAMDSVAQTRTQKVAEKTRLLFLVDASGSMLEPWVRSQSKIVLARTILTRVVDSLRQNTKVELALRLYGHQFPPGVNNCKDTRLEVPFKAGNHQAIIDRINRIKPNGVTPISYALEQAANDFPSQAGYRNIVILITDGVESCGGDPCATSIALQRKGVFLQPYIIGLGMQAEKTLECAGKYLNADTPGKFYDVLNEAIERSFAKTTVSVSLAAPNKKPVSNVNVSFRNTYTGVSMYEFVNYVDANGKTDSVEVDPMIEYDLVVNTLPPVIKPRIGINPGSHTHVDIPVQLGTLLIRHQEKSSNIISAVVREKGKNEILHMQTVNQSVRYLSGKYEVETFTLPRRIFDISIEHEKTFTLSIPAPGLVNFNTISSGYGSVYEIMKDGTQQWVCDVNEQRSTFSLTLLPGQYKIAFRVKNSPGSKYTAQKTFTIKSGTATQVALF